MNATILIVEDEALIAMSLQQKLQQAGYNAPIIADNAADALLGVERLRPSLVLMDIRLKGPQDGIETADRIRRRFDVPVLFVTAHADIETLNRARITEPFGYIVKPFQGVDFRAQIEIALWKHGMEQKLRASEAWLSATFRNVSDALIATDREGNIAFMNPPAAELTGWDRNESKGMPFLDLFQAVDEITGKPVAHPLEAIEDGREPGKDLCAFRLFPRGASHPVIVEAAISANRDGETLLGIIVVFRDLTERRRMEEQSRRIQKMDSLVLFCVGLGRELAEAQRAIDATIEQLIEEAQGSHTRRLLGDIYERSAYQQSIIQQLIAWGKTGAGEAVMVDLNEILAQMEATFRKALGNGRSLTLKLQEDIPPIKVDPKDLWQNLRRLVVDARHAMPEGSAMEISTAAISTAAIGAAGKPGVQIAIRDTGKSILSNAKDRVFDPYYQSRPGSRNPALSLALVYRFVALSGGVINVESDPGKGTAYLLNFPAAEYPRLPPESPREHVPVSVWTGAHAT